MAIINFSQKEVDGTPISGAELDSSMIQGDNISLLNNDILKIGVNGDAVGVAGTAGQILKIIAGAPSFANFSSDEVLNQTGHVVLDNGLIFNWQTTTALAALATIALVHSKPFSTLNFGNFVNVIDVNSANVEVISEDLLGFSIKNFDSINAATTVRIFSAGI